MTNLSTIMNHLASVAYGKGRWAGYYEAQDVEVPEKYQWQSIDIPTISTSQLVAELEKRDGVDMHDVDTGDICEISYERKEYNFGHIFCSIPRYDGPVKILVVRE